MNLNFSGNKGKKNDACLHFAYKSIPCPLNPTSLNKKHNNLYKLKKNDFKIFKYLYP